jgi:hypothetical protein
MNAGRTCTQLTVRVIYPIGLKVLPELRSARLTIVAMGKPGIAGAHDNHSAKLLRDKANLGSGLLAG